MMMIAHCMLFNKMLISIPWLHTSTSKYLVAQSFIKKQYKKTEKMYVDEEYLTIIFFEFRDM